MQRRTTPVYKIVGGILFVLFLGIVGGSLWLLLGSGDAQDDAATITPEPVAVIESDTPIPTETDLSPSATTEDSEIILSSDTPTVTATLEPSITPSLTYTPSLTFTPSLSPTPISSDTPSPTFTPSITITPFPSATLTPQATHTPTATFTRIPGAPTAVMRDEPVYELTNILLIGSDQRPGQGDFRTDVLVIVSINYTTGTVNMLSLPRDLYVYIPSIGYNRINTAALWGETTNWEGGGFALLKETIRYNLGINIDHYAMVNFSGFVSIIDELGGVDLVVECALADYRLVTPDANPNLFSNYEWVEMDVGVHRMTGANALWYARSRATTSDFDRNRRHQMLLRAIWQRFIEESLWDTIPALWREFSSVVVTDMTLSDIVQYIPLGARLNPNLIESHYITVNAVENYTTSQGAAVLRLRPVAIAEIVDDFLLPPTANQLFQESVHIEVVNQSGRDHLEEVAAAVLSEQGFLVEIGDTLNDEITDQTQLIDFSGDTKGSSLGYLTQRFWIEAEDVFIEPDPNRTVDYRLVLGSAFNSCGISPNRG